MKSRAVSVFLLIGFLLVSSKAGALDFKECLLMGMAHSDQIKAAKAQVDQSEAERLAAVSGFLPGMKADASALKLDVHSTYKMEAISLPPGTSSDIIALLSAMDFSSLTAVPDHSNDLTITAYQPLSMLPQIGLYNKIAANGKRMAELTYEITEDQIALYLGSAYFNVLINTKKVKAMERAEELIDRHVKDAALMLAQGMITKADMLKFEMHQSNVKIQLEQARQDLAQSKSVVARLLGLKDGNVDYADLVPTLAEEKDLSWYLTEGQKERRELQLASLGVRNARAARSAAFLDMVPKINAVAAANWNDDGLDTTPDRTYSAGLVMEWNFWNWGGDLNKARAAEFARKRAEHLAASSTDEIILGIEKAWRDARVARLMVETQKRTLAQAEENYRIEQSRYNVGKTTTTDLLDAQTQLTSAEVGYSASLYGAALADAALMAAIGQKPFPEILGGQK